MWIKKWLACLCFVIPFWVYAQNEKPDIRTELNPDMEQQIESISEELDDETTDFSESVEEMAYYAEHKMNLNDLDYDNLATIFRLTDYQVYHLKKYQETYGQIYSVYELLAVEGFDRATAERLIPYMEALLKPTPQWRLKTAFRYGKHKTLIRYGQILEKQQGYIKPSDVSKPHYTGSRQALLLKYKFQYKDKLQFGLTAEKDAGEPFFTGSNRQGFDFYSFHLFVRDVGKLRALAVGDYHLSFGQGLAMNTCFAIQTPHDAASVNYKAKGLKPYFSANEYNYLRGAASRIDCKVLSLTLFYSFKRLDAAITTENNASENEYLYIKTLQQTGYHRTPTEIAQKNSIYQHLAGFHVDVPFRTAKVGATMFYTRFKHPLGRNLSFYNMYAFNAQDNLNASIDYTALYRKVNFFGEIAISKNTGIATLNGMIFHFSSRFTASVLHRYYGNNYQALHASAFGEASDHTAEHGVFIGTNLFLSKHWSVNASADYFRFNWLKYRIDAPSDGFGVQSRLHFDLDNHFSFYVQVRYKSKSVNEDAVYYNTLTQTCKQNYRLHIDYLPFDRLKLKSRLEIVNYQPYTGAVYRQGYLMYQDIAWFFQKIPLMLAVRLAVFDAYSYDERIYAYESDVLYAFSVPCFYGKGGRIYLMSRFGIGKYVDLGVKWAQTFYADRQTIGSGLTLIDGNHKQEIKVEIILTIK